MDQKNNSVFYELFGILLGILVIMVGRLNFVTADLGEKIDLIKLAQFSASTNPIPFGIVTNVEPAEVTLNGVGYLEIWVVTGDNADEIQICLTRKDNKLKEKDIVSLYYDDNIGRLLCG